jgi:hypothetical protein
MNEHHTRFYSGQNRQAMHRTFTRLVQALRTDDFSSLPELCTPDCVVDISTVGHLVGIPAIAEGLRWPGPATDISKAGVWNFVARSSGDRGVQTADVQLIRAIDDGNDLHPFLWGLQFSNKFVHIGGRWLISHMRVDLCYEAGNNDFVRPSWNLMNHARYTGHTPMISAEFDNPWRSILVDDEPQTDVEQVFELMYRYAYAFDNGDFDFLLTFVTDDFFINGATAEKPDPHGHLDPGDLVGHREIVDFLKDKFHKEAKMMHACRMGAITIDGDHATAWMPRGEEHRLRNRVLDRHNVHSAFTTAVHKLSAVKIDNEWRLARYRIELASDATPIPDDIVTWDEYLTTEVAS